jgi:TRAP-type C4-dicarboxylate transport system substrate-binding protein
VANYLVARINGMMAVNPLYMSMETYNKLSEKERKIIIESGQEACKWMQEKYLEIEKGDLKFLEEKGMVVFYPSDEEVIEWYKKGSKVYDLYREEYDEEAVNYILEEIVK